MKEYVALLLSTVSIILSLCCIIGIEPFSVAGDTILGASLSVISICTAVIVAYQIFNNVTIEKRLRKIIGEEYSLKFNEEMSKNKVYIAKNLLADKLYIVTSLVSSGLQKEMYPIVVSALDDCVVINDEQFTKPFCNILTKMHKNLDLTSVCAYNVYFEREIKSLRKLASDSDDAMKLLILIGGLNQ